MCAVYFFQGALRFHTVFIFAARNLLLYNFKPEGYSERILFFRPTLKILGLLCSYLPTKVSPALKIFCHFEEKIFFSNPG